MKDERWKMKDERWKMKDERSIKKNREKIIRKAIRCKQKSINPKLISQLIIQTHHNLDKYQLLNDYVNSYVNVDSSSEQTLENSTRGKTI